MRLIDADELAKDLDYDVEMCARALDRADLVGDERERIQLEKDCKQNCMWYLTEAETVDAVTVVRCKDCQHSQHDEVFNDCWCDGRRVKPDHFCGYGKRKEGCNDV